MNHRIKNLALIAALLLTVDRGLTGCSPTRQVQVVLPAAVVVSTPAPTHTGGDYTDTRDGGHAIHADGVTLSYANATVTKTGDAEGDKADFYGENAAILAENGAALTLREISVTTDGTHANAVFACGEGTVVDIAHATVTTAGNCSGGIMTTGGATMLAENLVVRTSGNSSAAIRSDRGGGTVTVTGGTYSTEGVGSPAVYSTADITVVDAELSTTASQGVVVEGKNSVTLQNVTLTANNVKKNSGKSPWYQAVMLYQSMSGDASVGTASFTMEGGSLTNLNGDIFFVNNTTALISLHDTLIINDDPEGVFLRAAAAGWGREGENGGHVTLRAFNQEIEGDMLVDAVSSLELLLAEGCVFTGAIVPEAAENVSVTLANGARWVLTGDSAVGTLQCDEGQIDLNGYTLTVGGKEYQAPAETAA